MNENLTRCIGLWLAEGDNKTNREITFTNNSLELILFFHENISKLYKGKNKPRLYVYSPDEQRYFSNLLGFKTIRFYIDDRANKSYYIYRLADTKFVRFWKNLVDKTKINPVYYISILSGIFAGEGNIKYSLKHNSRNIRISSGKRDNIIEIYLNHLKVPIKYDANKRNYIVTGKNISIFNDNHICTLHPEKGKQFRKMIKSVKEKHYSPHFLRKLVLEELYSFVRTKDLANKFNRSQLRVYDVLGQLRNENKADYIKINGFTYWASKELIENYILTQKISILKALSSNKTFTSIGKCIHMDRKAVKRKLVNLEKEGYVKRTSNYWKMTSNGKRLIAGIDEAGRF